MTPQEIDAIVDAHQWEPTRDVCRRCGWDLTRLLLVRDYEAALVCRVDRDARVVAARRCTCGVAAVGGKHSSWCDVA